MICDHEWYCYFAMWLYSSFIKEGIFSSLPWIWAFSWFVLASRMWQKVRCANSKPRPQEALSALLSCLGPSDHIQVSLLEDEKSHGTESIHPSWSYRRSVNPQSTTLLTIDPWARLVKIRWTLNTPIERSKWPTILWTKVKQMLTVLTVVFWGWFFYEAISN